MFRVKVYCFAEFNLTINLAFLFSLIQIVKYVFTYMRSFLYDSIIFLII